MNHNKKTTKTVKFIKTMEKTRIPLYKLLPSMLTIAALCLGVTAIHYAMLGNFKTAVALVFIAGFLDLLDGKLARFLNSVSEFGAQLDSLADLISFGVAPGIIVYLWSLQKIPYEGFGWGIILIYISCSALRLARFNIGCNLNVDDDTKNVIKDNNSKKFKKELLDYKRHFFTGLPIPAAAVFLLMPLVFTFELNVGYKFSHYFIAAYIVIIGWFMVSTVPIFSGKYTKIPRKHISLVIIALWLIVGSIVIKPWIFTIFFSGVYLIVIIFSIILYSKKVKKINNDINSANIEE